MTQGMMKKLHATVSWKRVSPDSDETKMTFSITSSNPEPYKETAKQFMVGKEGGYRNRVSKDDYMVVRHEYGDSPSWQQYSIWCKVEDEMKARILLKEVILNRYQHMLKDCQEAVEAIQSYDIQEVRA